MLKLMKYEFRKQLFSKFAILGILGLMELWFLYGLLANKENTYMTAALFLMLLALIVMLYVSFECMLTFNNDLKTKQSYMLFMVPESTYSIMGAKVLSAMIQIFLTMLLFGIVAFADIMAVFSRNGEIEAFITGIQNLLRDFLNLDISLGKIVIVIVSYVVSWFSMIVMGMFSVVLSATFMANNRLKTLISFVIFIVLNVIVNKVNRMIIGGFRAVYADYIKSIIFLFIVSIIMYFVTAWMLDKKVSV